MSGDAQSGSAFRLLPAVFCKLKNPCQARRLMGGIVCGEALGAAAKSVLHLQKTRSLRSKKSAAALQHFYFLLGMMCHGAWGVPARSVLHLQKTRCLEGAGKAALELDAACPSLTRFQFHVYSNASCGSQFQSRADFSALTKSSEDFETAEALRLALPRAPSTRISHLKLPRAPSTRIPHLKLPRAPSTKIPILKLPRATLTHNL